jgi:hypothetical protein
VGRARSEWVLCSAHAAAGRHGICCVIAIHIAPPSYTRMTHKPPSCCQTDGPEGVGRKARDAQHCTAHRRVFSTPPVMRWMCTPPAGARIQNAAMQDDSPTRPE